MKFTRKSVIRPIVRDIGDITLRAIVFGTPTISKRHWSRMILVRVLVQVRPICLQSTTVAND